MRFWTHPHPSSAFHATYQYYSFAKSADSLTYHVEYMIADKLGAGVNVEKVRVGQGRWPNERHGQFSVGVNFQSTELVFRMLHREWRETKQQLN